MMGVPLINCLPPELLICIFSRLHPQYLPFAALVCHAWCGPATQVLWSTTEVPLGGLLKLIAPLTQEGQFLRFQNEDDELDVGRCIELASHVRRLFIAWPLSTETCTLLREYLFGAGALPLCPRLRRITIYTGCDVVQTCKIVAGPSIRLLENIGMPKGATYADPLLQSLRDICPLLDEISSTLGTIHTGLGYYPHLRSLFRRGSFGFKTWELLSDSCSKLEKITLEIIEMEAPTPDSKVVPNRYLFPSLRCLTCHLNLPYYSNRLFIESKMPELRYFKSSIMDHAHVELSGGAVLRHFAETSPHLEEFRLAVYCKTPIAYEALQSLHSMKRLELECMPETALITDDQLHLLAQSMPLLETLLMTPDSTEPDHPVGLGLRALISLATYCHSLDRLMLPLNTTDKSCSSAQMHEQEMTPFQRLRIMELEPVYIEQGRVKSIAESLRSIAPTVKVFKPTIVLCIASEAGDGSFNTMYWSDEESEDDDYAYIGPSQSEAATQDRMMDYFLRRK